MPVRVAIDAMGGDHAPAAVVEGSARAARDLGESVRIQLFGPEAALRAVVDGQGAGELFDIVDAPQVIGMAESPASAVKGKPDSSIVRGIAAQKHGLSDAFVSAGNTGAVLAASLFVLGRVKGVSRPAVVGVYPTVKGFCIVLDVGTNVDCKPSHLVEFAQMGRVYAESVLKRPFPTIALMNIGEEPGKGNEQAKAAYDLLTEVDALNFVGNIEGRDLMRHAADVVVCDGFVGNIMLKLGESVASVLPQMLMQEIGRLGLSSEDQSVVLRAFGALGARFDYEEYGGVPLLGVDGTVLIGHGGSGPRAFEQLVHVAAAAVTQDVPGQISAALGGADA